jgi:uncharacterized membrane protein YcgQ (UPF0703/DUF1980 family)
MHSNIELCVYNHISWYIWLNMYIYIYVCMYVYIIYVYIKYMNHFNSVGSIHIALGKL